MTILIYDVTSSGAIVASGAIGKRGTSGIIDVGCIDAEQIGIIMMLDCGLASC